MTRLRVVIVGAGIAGLTTALALSELGHDLTLVERRTGFGETGAGIQLSPNASRILIAWGLGASLARFGCEPDRVAMRAVGSGRDLASVPLGPGMRVRYGAPYAVMARSHLHTALLDAVRGRGNVRLLVGRTLVSAEDGPETATLVLETENGATENIAADLVVGADGLWSRTRAALGDGRAPAYSGFTASRAVIPASRLPERLGLGDTGLWLGRGRHVVHYAIDAGRQINIVVVERRREPRTGWSEPENADELLSRFDAAAPLLRSLLAIPPAWSAWSLFDLPVRRMAGRRIALAGDAAHPVLPYLAQGGALAIEDAAELAAQIGRAQGEIGAALAAYQAVRLTRVRKVQGEARRNGRIYHLGGAGALARNLVLSRSRPASLADRFDWLYGARTHGPA